jgi:hypothetical protein
MIDDRCQCLEECSYRGACSAAESAARHALAVNSQLTVRPRRRLIGRQGMSCCVERPSGIWRFFEGRQAWATPMCAATPGCGGPAVVARWSLPDPEEVPPWPTPPSLPLCHPCSTKPNSLRQRFAWCANHSLPPFAARRGHMELWARDMQEHGRAASTVAHRLSTVARFYRFAVIDGLVEHSPAAFVRRRRPPFRPQNHDALPPGPPQPGPI